MTELLAGRGIVITGSARGLGLAFAEACAAAGARVVMADILGQQVQTEAAGLQAKGYQVYPMTLDLADFDSITAVADAAIEALGKVDGLVNCGAIATGIGGLDLEQLESQTWDQVMAVNVRGLWQMTKALTPALRASGQGKVVNIASDTALWGAPKLLAYVASKGAVIAMGRSMARELGPDNICVNTLCPGLTLGEATDYVPEERHRQYVEGRAIPRPQTAEDVTGSLVYLLSDMANFVTGQTIPVNGGFVFN